ncbi:MAG: hypothetical protein L0191_14915 [Acidobacteria bacterium]|nr:hypothetical protein [Acidobacteriota bacterium]
MKGLWKFIRVTPLLLLPTMAISGGCASGGGPVPVQGEVTGKHQTAPSGNQLESPGKEKPRYFLWVKTKGGPAFVEVTEDVFRRVTEGDQVCINCGSGSR